MVHNLRAYKRGNFMEKKIAIITTTVAATEEEYRSAQIMAAKYGNKIIHVTWPNNFMAEPEQMISIVKGLAVNPEVKALVINQGVPGTNAAIDKLLETRNDIFIVYCNPQENPPDVAARARLVLKFDETGRNEAPVQAKKMGAKAFVHYSFPRHMATPYISKKRDIIKAKCAEIGLEFVEVSTIDPLGPGLPGAIKFYAEDVPKKVEKYGKDIAFYSTNCLMQAPLIKEVMNAGAIYPMPCCPSPYHGFPQALGIASHMEDPDDLQRVIDKTRKILKEKGLEGRFSACPVPGAMMFTVAATEYAIKVINGSIGMDGLNLEVLKKCLSDYAKVNVSVRPYVEDDGKEYPNYLLALMEFFTY